MKYVKKTFWKMHFFQLTNPNLLSILLFSFIFLCLSLTNYLLPLLFYFSSVLSDLSCCFISHRFFIILFPFRHFGSFNYSVSFPLTSFILLFSSFSTFLAPKLWYFGFFLFLSNPTLCKNNTPKYQSFLPKSEKS